MIALRAVARYSGPFALILLWVPSKSHSVGGGLKIPFSGGWSQNPIQWGVVSKSHSVWGGLKIPFSVGCSQNHIQWGVVSKSHSVGGGLKITFSGGWSGPPENIVLLRSQHLLHHLACLIQK